MTRVLLDTNVYDKIYQDKVTCKRLARMIERGRIKVLVPSTVNDELSKSPFKGIPDCFPITPVGDSVFILGHSRLGKARLSKGDIYTKHKGTSKQIPDAIIADTANERADIFVSEDSRSRRRLADLSNNCKIMSYSDFTAWLASEEET